MARIETNPNPAVLVWARKSRGFSHDDASKRIGVPSQRLAEWEAGASKPTYAQLRRIAAVYKRPVAAFYLREAPNDFAVMHDFRRHPDGQTGAISPELALEIRRGYDRREWALELFSQLDETPNEAFPRIRLDQDVEEAANTLRDFLQLDVKTQARWQERAFPEWRRVVENAGILTFEMTTVPVEEARGFSIGKKPMPVAVANIKDSPRARVFTLLHETAHILLGADGICDLSERSRGDSGRLETFCNQVAGASIFPRDSLLQSPTVRDHEKGRAEWTDQELRSIANIFGGSRESALVRLRSLGLTTQAFCDARRSKFREEYRAERDRRAALDAGFVPPHQLALLSAGPLFVSLVVENFNRERITASDFADYLQIRARHIAEIQQDYAGFNR
jgi:Zn-dependent peptidase ImmA (M78 family)/DNA-binding XRE family transcriptional regulator